MRRFLCLIPAILTHSAIAQTVVTSASPEAVSVTLYRDPNRSDGGINAQFPGGFALISEKRRIALPAGETVIRFEDVVDGMLAVSAVVTGLPGGVVQKNRDTRLLSPAALLDGMLGNRVHLRRTDPVTGTVRELEAVIRSGPDNAVVLETAEGFEGLRCSGLPESLIYDAIPSGLSARPTFSVTTRSPTASSVEVTLTYLSTGFDWGASYVARIAPDGRTLDLSAWLTVANGNSTGLPEAQMLAVAGRLNRESGYDALEVRAPSPYLNLQCWPLPEYKTEIDSGYELPPPPSPMMSMALEDVVVTASRRVARQEDLGDLKLYRVPMRVDINAKAQKQVALMERNRVPFSLHYIADLWAKGDRDISEPLNRMIKMQNDKTDGLGLPLPSGGITLFTQVQDESLLLADTRMRDHTIGEAVKLDAGMSAQHRYQMKRIAGSDIREIMLTNASNISAQAEIRLRADDGDQLKAKSTGSRLIRKDGAWLWVVTIPANGTVRLRYTILKAA